MKNQHNDIVEQQYKMHDIAERILKNMLEVNNIEYIESGYDSRVDDSKNGNKHISGKPKKYNDMPDLYLYNHGVFIDIKTTKYEKYLGNIRLEHAETYTKYENAGYPVFVVAMANPSLKFKYDKITTYLMGSAEFDGTNTNAYGQIYLNASKSMQNNKIDDLFTYVDEYNPEHNTRVFTESEFDSYDLEPTVKYINQKISDKLSD